MIVFSAEQSFERAGFASSPTDDPRGRYEGVRAETERLASGLTAEDQCVQSMPDASPVKWHRAHTTWFFESFILQEYVPGYCVFHPGFGYLFNSYYEAQGARHERARRGLLTRPSAAEVSDYRRHVDRAMCELLTERGDDPALSRLIELGLQHEQQHQELLLTDILHVFAQNPLLPAYIHYRPGEATSGRPASFVEFEGGRVFTGHDEPTFAFDNESPRHETLLPPYRLMNRLVTNGEWLAFMEDGGYAKAALWLSDGWHRARQEHWNAPLYWECRDGDWLAMTLSGLKPIEREAPVTHVSYYEADAFARWSGRRLPREAEWEHAASHQDPKQGNFRDSGYLRPLPAGRRPDPQLYGDVWEWTASPYTPYPGYRTPEGAVGEYNGKFMINQMVLRGGSCVTGSDHIRGTYRNFFYPHQRWQFTGLRLAEDAPRMRTGCSNFLEDVQAGLSKPAKALPSKYFYDATGSRLYEKICSLEEYYLTRTEARLLRELAPELSPLVPARAALVDFGCGSSVKTRILLKQVRGISLYVPVDICEESLEETTQAIRQDFPRLVVRPIGGDFLGRLPAPAELKGRPVIGFFPGSTIGNLSNDEAARFLRVSRDFLGAGARFLIGIDLVKKTEDLVRAYDDAQGVTAAFNKNLLARINRELGADFDTDRFSHRALWNEVFSRIEMHLVSGSAQKVRLAGRVFDFASGETIHTENSHKYTLDGFGALAARAGWSVERSWSSSEPAYAVLLLH